MSGRASASSALGRRARRDRRLLVVGLLAAGVIAADQVSKSFAVADFSGGPHHVIGPLSLALAYNSGGAFSLGAGFAGIVVVGALLALGALTFFYRRTRGWLASISFGLVLGGALSNLGDRVFRGHGGSVVDFIHTGFWPTFNLADAAITCGCVGFAVVLWRSGTRTPPASAVPEAPHAERVR